MWTNIKLRALNLLGWSYWIGRPWAWFIFALNLISLVSIIRVESIDAPRAVSIWCLALGLQWPIVLAVCLAHGGLALFWRKLPRFLALGVATLITVPLITIVAVLYLSSQQAYSDNGIHLRADLLEAIIPDAKQVLSQAFAGYGFKLTAGILFCALIACFWAHKAITADLNEKANIYPQRLKLFSILSLVAIVLVVPIDVLPKKLKDQALTEGFPTITVAGTALDLRGGDHSEQGKNTTQIQPRGRTGTGKNTSQAPLVVQPLDARKLSPVVPVEKWVKTNPIKGKKPNVFLIMLESVSSDHVGFNGYFRKDLTPNLDALSLDSVNFPHTYAASNHSNYSQTSFHASQYARRGRHLNRFNRLDYPRTLLFDLLGAQGYQTAFISAQNENWQGMRRFLTKDSKYDLFVHSLDVSEDKRIGKDKKIDDRIVVDMAIDVLENKRKKQTDGQDKPVFMYLNLQRTHFPYELWDDVRLPYPDADTSAFRFTFFSYPKKHMPTVRNSYDNALHYVDAQLGRFFDHLKAKGLYENSIIAISADHGEAFYEQHYPSHGTSMYDDQIKVFTLFKLPNSRVKGRRDYGISLIDIVPTVLHELGMPPHPNFQGYQVIDAGAREAPIFITAQGVIKADAVIDHPWKFFRSKKDGKKLINTVRDPKETKDYSKAEPRRRALMEHALDVYIQHQEDYYIKLKPGVRSKRYPPKFEADLIGKSVK